MKTMNLVIHEILMKFYQLNLELKFDNIEIENNGKYSWINYDSIWLYRNISVFIHYQKSKDLNEETLHLLIRKPEKEKINNYAYIVEKDNHGKFIYNEEVHEKENNFILESLDDTMIDMNSFDNENQFFEKLKSTIII